MQSNPHTQRPGRPLPPATHQETLRAANSAARTIAPLWPLKSFVAVNPFHGIASFPYADRDNSVERIWGARLVMNRSFYADAIRDGKIQRQHIEQALDEVPSNIADDYTPDSIHLLAFTEEPDAHPTPTIAELLTRETGFDWQEFAVDRISFWASGYFDEGQAGWRSPWRDDPPYLAWRGEAQLDRTPEIMGVPEFRSIVRSYPEDADELLFRVTKELGLRGEALPIYFRRLLATVAGWAGHARYLGWKDELAGRSDERVKSLLAIRAAWDLALHEAFAANYPDLAEQLRQRLTTPLHPDIHKAHAVNLILHTAFEIAGREPLLTRLPATDGNPGDTGDSESADAARPKAQAVFCIDVRSERVRRAVEKRDDRIRTLGFAGFFGFALEVASIDGADGGAQCPVLLEPQFALRETLSGASPGEVDRLEQQSRLNRRLRAAWKHFSAAAVSSFAFVESLGFTYAWKLVLDTLGMGRDERDARLAPGINPTGGTDSAGGIPLASRIETARSALAGMSLVDGFAPLVALVGHGSAMSNNPYESRFHCGACGGHTGEANARVAAAVLNDPAVRDALEADGISIPRDTLFVAGLHDTTTDSIRLFESPETPATRMGEIRSLEALLDEAAGDARRERAASFGLSADDEDLDRKIRRRSTDWSEVRPEWGLAGCLAFIAAPRERTRHLDLGGRAFLHSYDRRIDGEDAVLEVIMTAPLIVASWISLQYYASTIDNRVFGSGDKTLHNVVGGLGVLEGNGGDLRVGLPRQSLHDGERFVHEPMRLNAFIEAPTTAIANVLEKHEHLRELVENGWIHLFAITDEGRAIKRYTGEYCWSDALDSVGLSSQVNRTAERRIA